MEQELEVEVEIISNEMVKPSLPQPSNPTTFTLPLIDQIVPAFHIPLLLYYDTFSSPTQQDEVDISTLKTSLSQTLDQFFPIAGRLIDESAISCNHMGIPFIETKVNCHLSVALTSLQKVKLLPKFLPPPELQASGLQPISELVPLAFQVNVFQCGGVVIGCYMLHKFLDAASIGTFFRYWSALSSNRLTDLALAQPNFEATLNVYPPLPRKEEHVSSLDIDLLPPPTQSNLKTTVSIKSFIFDTNAINKLKAEATSELVPKPTGFEVVVGFVWEHTLSMKHNSTFEENNDTPPSSVSIAVNMRPRMNPPIPKESMGNIITMAEVSVPNKTNNTNNTEFQELVKEIHVTLSETYQKINDGSYKGEKMKARLEESAQSVGGMLLTISSWCKMGLNEADFGFGKPLSIVPTDGKQPPLAIKNVCCLTDYCHPVFGQGIEVWLQIEENDMQILESNPDFLAFASPS